MLLNSDSIACFHRWASGPRMACVYVECRIPESLTRRRRMIIGCHSETPAGVDGRSALAEGVVQQVMVLMQAKEVPVLDLDRDRMEKSSDRSGTSAQR